MSMLVQPVRIWTLACPNPECDLVGVEIEAPSKIAVSHTLATRPQYVCTCCEWDLQRLPDRPVELKLTEEQAQLLARAIEESAEGVDGDDHIKLVHLRTLLP